jgi:mannose-6-phosphate isomerase-like protein (cupin superfamily)
MVERIIHEGVMLGLIVRAGFHKEGIEFFTPDDFSQQLAYMNRPAGYTIPPHTHNAVPREVHKTLETLFIKSGRIRVDFYTADQRYVGCREIAAGDVLLLSAGGHGFEILEPAEFIEVKQGPYAGDQDKVRFEGVRHG